MNFNITKDSHIQQPNIYTSEVFVHKSSDGLTTYSLSHLFVQFLLLISHTHRWTHSISLFQPLGDDNRLEPRQSAATEISDNKHQQQHQHGIPSSYRLNRAILSAEKGNQHHVFLAVTLLLQAALRPSDAPKSFASTPRSSSYKIYITSKKYTSPVGD
jgi:hypothetical protein